MKVYSDAQHVNVGSGEDIAIYDLAKMVASAVGFTGAIETDTSKPDGTPKKLMSAERASSGLAGRGKVSLEDGVREVYRGYVA